MVFQRFPTYGDRTIGLYYLLSFSFGVRFIQPNWLFYFSIFIPLGSAFLIDGISKIVGIFLEVPSGALADFCGKKFTLIAGLTSFIVQGFLVLFWHSFLGFLVAQIILVLGFALLSGSKEAYLYEHLLSIKKETHYDLVLGRVNSIATASYIFSLISSGLLYSINPWLSYLAWIITSVLGIIILCFMPETNKKSRSEIKAESGSYLQVIRSGFSIILKKPFLTFILPVMFFAVLPKSYEGAVRQATGLYFGYDGETLGYLIGIVLIPALFVSYNFGKLSTYLGKKLELLFLTAYLLGFGIVLLTNNLALGAVSFFFVYTAQEIINPYRVSLINKNVDSEYRATAISTVTLFSDMPYILISILFTSLFTLEDHLLYLYGGFITTIVFYFVAYRLKTKWNYLLSD